MIKYKDFKKFHSFAIEKNAKDAIDLHLSQSFPMENFSKFIRDTVKRLWA